MENADTPKKIIDSAVKTFGRIDVLVNTSEHDGQQSGGIVSFAGHEIF